MTKKMDRKKAIEIYLKGLINDFNPMTLSKAVDLIIENSNNSKSSRFLTTMSPYLANFSFLNIHKEVSHFSELILNNPTPLIYYDDLHLLLMKHANKNEPLAKYIAHKILIACCGKTHLYESLQFSNRKPVTAIFEKYFTELAIKNMNYSMRWKKFLYREYCLESNLPFCPSASCSECPSYSTCYTK